MAEVIHFTTAAALPDRVGVLAAQGVPAGAVIPDKVERLADLAFARFAELAAPVGICREVSRSLFAAIHAGEGLNAPATPLPEVLEEASDLALFAVTLGAPVCDEIGRLFAANDPALGCMLDAVASQAAEGLAAAMATAFEKKLGRRGSGGRTARVLPYSPGYCGWHVTGQRRLFAELEPAAIGITLTPSCLMQPLKSVSGVLVSAPAEAHAVEPCYPFCADCADQSCRRRSAAVTETATGG